MIKLKIIIGFLAISIQLDCAGISDLSIDHKRATKLSPSLKRYLIHSDTRDKEIFLLTSNSIEILQSRINAEKKNIKLMDLNVPSNSIKIECKIGYFLHTILSWTEIIFADKYETPHEEIIIKGYDRSFHGLNYIDQYLPDANGKNIVVGIKERKMDEADMDLVTRIKPSPISSNEITSHATEISTLIGGAGNSFYTGRGIANACYFFSSSFDNLFADEIVLLETNKVSIQNHSYGTIIQNYYGAEAVSYDVQTWKNKNLVHVFSAGNSGELVATDGKYIIPGFANTTANFKSAKNILLVGALDNTGQVSGKSSSGPLYDGRLGPHLVASGPNGTSDAAAIVSGTAAVMQQSYADKNKGLLPPASLIKAIILNTADDTHNPGIDFRSGYGILNSRSAIESILNNEFYEGMLSTGQTWEKEINLTNNINQLKITLTWTDSAASVNNQRALINDLDLEVEELSTNKIYLPWILNTFPLKDSLEKQPVRMRDSLNTAEQVTIVKPTGKYKIRVRGYSLPSIRIPFHISFKIDSLNTFTFTAPIHSSDVNKADSAINIKWHTVVNDDVQSGNLLYSYDLGKRWELISNQVSLKKGIYRWRGKDTSSLLMFKMQTPFGDFSSNPIIVEKSIRPRLEYNCTDSLKIVWSPYVYSQGYKLYTLVDSPYLKHIFTVSDTFIVLEKSKFPFKVIAIEPKLAVDIPPQRSEAFTIQNQRTFCYFNTFYLNLIDGNKADLILELSTTYNIDTVVFEQLSSDSRLIKEIKKTAVQQDKNLHALTDELPLGISYFRCQIKLKNGGISYTETISSITSGKENILLYPNPLKQNSRLQYVLKQGIDPDINFQLFDLTGKIVLDLKSISNNLELAGIGPGLYIYRVTSVENIEIQSGKIMIL